MLGILLVKNTCLKCCNLPAPDASGKLSCARSYTQLNTVQPPTFVPVSTSHKFHPSLKYHVSDSLSRPQAVAACTSPALFEAAHDGASMQGES